MTNIGIRILLASVFAPLALAPDAIAQPRRNPPKPAPGAPAQPKPAPAASEAEQAIRKAAKKDGRAILNLIAQGVANDELVRRSRAEIERTAEDFFVFEVDKLPVACAAVHLHPTEGKAELACVCVDPRFENRGIGRKMIEYGETLARQAGMREMFLLSTQAFNYFQQKGGFSQGSPADLPASRREKYDKSGRRSLVLVKRLDDGIGSNHGAR